MVKIPVYESSINRGAANTSNVGLGMQKQASDFYDGDPRAESIQSNYRYQEDVRSAQQMAEGMQSVSNGLLKLEQKISKTKSDDAFIKLTTDLDKKGTELKNSLKGLNVEKIPEEWNTYTDQQFNNIIGSVPVTMRDEFSQRIALYKSNKINNLSSYSSQELDKARQENHQAIKENLIQGVKDDPNSPMNILTAEAQGIKQIESQAAIDQKTPDIVINEKKEFLNSIHGTRILGLIDKDIKAARQAWKEAVTEGKLYKATSGALDEKLTKLEDEESMNEYMISRLEAGKDNTQIVDDILRDQNLTQTKKVDYINKLNSIKTNMNQLDVDRVSMLDTQYGGLFAEFRKLASEKENEALANDGVRKNPLAEQLVEQMPESMQSSMKAILSNGFATKNDPATYGAVLSEIYNTNGNTNAIFENADKLTTETISDLDRIRKNLATSKKVDKGNVSKRSEWVKEALFSTGLFKKDAEGFIDVGDTNQNTIRYLEQFWDDNAKQLEYNDSAMTIKLLSTFNIDGKPIDPLMSVSGKIKSFEEVFSSDPRIVDILSLTVNGKKADDLDIPLEQSVFAAGYKIALDKIASSGFSYNSGSDLNKALDIGFLMIDNGSIKGMSKDEFEYKLNVSAENYARENMYSKTPFQKAVPNLIGVPYSAKIFVDKTIKKEVEKINKKLLEQHKIQPVKTLEFDMIYDNVNPYTPIDQKSEEELESDKQQAELDAIIFGANSPLTVYEEIGLPSEEKIEEPFKEQIMTPVEEENPKGQFDQSTEEDIKGISDEKIEDETIEEVKEHLCQYNYFDANYISGVSNRSIFESNEGYKVTSAYGKRLDPVLLKAGVKKYEMHKGVDFKVDSGTPLYSIIDGTVVRINKEDTGAGGKWVVIRNKKTGVEIMVCHLNDLNVELGDEVKYGNGKPFAFSGNTGSSTGPHVHFEFRIKGLNGKYETCDLWGLKEGEKF